jgi:hypothetical protein
MPRYQVRIDDVPEADVGSSAPWKLSLTTATAFHQIAMQSSEILTGEFHLVSPSEPSHVLQQRTSNRRLHAISATSTQSALELRKRVNTNKSQYIAASRMVS